MGESDGWLLGRSALFPCRPVSLDLFLSSSTYSRNRLGTKTNQEVDARRSARARCSAGYRAACACSSAVVASLLLMSSRCWPWPPCCVCMQQCRRRFTPSDVFPLLGLATVLRPWTKRLANLVSQRAIKDSGRDRKRSYRFRQGCR